jgi:hypothetical protein
MGGRGPRAVAMAAFAMTVVHHAMGAKVDVTFEITGSSDVSKVCACVCCVVCVCVCDIEFPTPSLHDILSIGTDVVGLPNDMPLARCRPDVACITNVFSCIRHSVSTTAWASQST